LDALINRIKPTTDDRIVILGDMIDRGPDSRGVLDRLIELRDQCRLVPLLGNHEEMLLAAREGKSDLRYWKKFGGQETLNSYGGLPDCRDIPWSHIRFIQQCRLYLETDSHIFVHAGLAPNHPMNQQSSLDLLWKPVEDDDIGPHYSGKTVIVGHTPQSDGQILDLRFLKCIDTYCHASGWLTALDVGSGQVWQANQKNEIREENLADDFRGRNKKCG
jgi:serine/threonine protein phosphatase 1